MRVLGLTMPLAVFARVPINDFLRTVYKTSWRALAFHKDASRRRAAFYTSKSSVH